MLATTNVRQEKNHQQQREGITMMNVLVHQHIKAQQLV